GPPRRQGVGPGDRRRRLDLRRCQAQATVHGPGEEIVRRPLVRLALATELELGVLQEADQLPGAGHQPLGLHRDLACITEETGVRSQEMASRTSRGLAPARNVS